MVRVPHDFCGSLCVRSEDKQGFATAGRCFGDYGPIGGNHETISASDRLWACEGGQRFFSDDGLNVRTLLPILPAWRNPFRPASLSRLGLCPHQCHRPVPTGSTKSSMMAIG